MFSSKIRFGAQQKTPTLKQFVSRSYYTISSDIVILDDNCNMTVVPLQKGRKLIAEYYAKKYGTNISFADNADLKDFLLKINEYIAHARKQPGNYRQAFFIGNASSHAVPIIYLKEGKNEGILFADSKGIKKWAVAEMAAVTGINVYAVKGMRQSDYYSCYTDALIMCRDTTAINSATGQYRIPNLLTRLASRANKVKKENYFLTKLPDELLKSSQISRFTLLHSENSTRNIHKNKTLTQFRNFYTDENVEMFSTNMKTMSDSITKKKNVANYLRLKGIKYADIIEIQFYCNRISKKAKNLWTDKQRENFIKTAKQKLLLEGTPSSERKGLHLLAQQTLASVLKSKSESEIFLHKSLVSSANSVELTTLESKEVQNPVLRAALASSKMKLG